MNRPPSIHLTALSLTLTLLAALHSGAATGELQRTWTFQAPPGTRLVVDAADTDVRLRVGDVDHIIVTVDMGISGVTAEQASTWIEHHTPRFEEAPGHLTIRLEPAPRGILGHVTSRARMGIVAPPRVMPDLTTTSGDIEVWGDFPEADPLYLRTLSGSIVWTGAARTVDIRTTTGRASVEVVRPLETFTASTSGGDVRLRGGARRTRVATASGEVHLEGLSGPTEVSTASGEIALQWDRIAPGTSVRVRSTRGRVRLQLPATVRPAGELRTTGGEIACELPEVVREGGTLRLEGSGPVLDVETSASDILLSLHQPGAPGGPSGG